MVVIGDFGTGSDEEAEVAAAVRRWVRRFDVDALVTTGDNIYDTGHPTEFREGWSEPYGWVDRSNLEKIAALGNHDVETDDGEPVMDLLDMPHRYYSERIGSAEILVLDANEPRDPDQLAWLKEQLRESDARWQIAAFHQPAYSCSHHDGEPEVQSLWVPLFERYGVDLVLNGHDHNYQRFALTNGVTYVVTGGGGNPHLYRIDECDEGTPELLVDNDRDHHFVAVEGSGRGLEVRAVTADGELIDRFRLSAQR